MKALLMRLVFCGMPALCVVGAGLFAFPQAPVIGLLFGACLFGLGWQVTKDNNHD